MTARPRPIVYEPRTIRTVLDTCATQSVAATAREFGMNASNIFKWRRLDADARAAGGRWPSDEDIDAFDARRAAYELNQQRRRAYKRRSRDGHVRMRINPTGTRRRLQALVALGWRYEDIAAEMGITKGRIGHLVTGMYSTIHRDAAAAVAAAYDSLSMAQGPSEKNRAAARRSGWLPPLAWDDDTIDDPAARPRRARLRGPEGLDGLDEVAIERAMHGDRVHLRPRERAEAVLRLTARGLSAGEIAALLDIEKRSVVRHRAAA